MRAKKTRGLGTALKTAELQAEYRLLPVLQPASLAKINGAVWGGWQQHALWMLAAYLQTGNFKHLLAFITQVHAMLQRSL
jgi:hypothetical protein